ncbi:hypothetical protein LCGC14_0266810 [marine sediment metagenome]|uniref:Uncharacterized protein n=1 Tax=marine sediment metagenome TaxID=412755 RepID=A0A0F9TZR9_9ZZZZ
MNVDIIKIEYMMNMIKNKNVGHYDLDLIMFILYKNIIDELFEHDGPYSVEHPWQPPYQQVD